MDRDDTVLAAVPPVMGGDRKHFLMAVAGPLRGLCIELPEHGSAVVGRQSEATILIDDAAVSAEHCRLSLSADRVLVEDLGSRNGTFIEGDRIEQPQLLPIGSYLQVGGTVFRHDYRSKRTVMEEQRREGTLDKAAAYVQSLLVEPIDTDTVAVDWRFIPSEELGGDVLGYHWLDEAHFALYLADVCGHGVAAALHSVSVLNVLRKNALPDVDFTRPTDVLRGLNGLFQMEEHADMYVTLWYGVYRPADRRLAYASAGHPPALLMDAGGGPPQRLTTGSLAVGIMPDAAFESAEVVVPSNARLLVYSDGVYEILTTDGNEWRLLDFVATVMAASTTQGGELERIEKQVREVMAAEVFDDDVSLLLARFP